MIRSDALVIPYQEAFRCFVPNRPGEDPEDHEHDFKVNCDWGFMCNQPDCGTRVDEQPCPVHAPKVAPPGWRLVECMSKEQLHWLLSHDRDDYGHGCPTCWSDHLSAKLKPLQEAAERREHRWCWLRRPCVKLLVKTRLWRTTSWSWSFACGGHQSFTWRWSR